MNKVLIIDDDKELCALMKKCIEQEKLSAVTVYNGIEGVRLIDENKDSYSLIILDVMLPDIDGFQILQKIRDTSNIPVLMLTAKSSEEDKVFGLRLGADDYLTKPFGINELLARVNSLIRRYTTLNPFTADIDSISLKDMVIDKLNRTVTVKDIPVLLTGKVWIIPISKTGYFFSKFIVVLSYSVCFMLLTAIASVFFGMLPGYITFEWNSISYLFKKCIEIAILTAFSILPLLAVAAAGKNYILPVCVTLVYTFLSFILLMVNMYLHPLSSATAIIMRDIPGVILAQEVNIPAALFCIGIWTIVSIVFAYISLKHRK